MGRTQYVMELKYDGVAISLSYLNGELVRGVTPVSYTHLRAHETPEHLVCRLLLEKKKQKDQHDLKDTPTSYITKQ